MRPSPYEGLTPTQVARRIAAPALFVGALFWFVLTHERPAPPAPPAGPGASETERTVTTFEGAALGTDFTVRLAGPPLDDAAQEAAVVAIRAELDEVDRLMSTWKDDSELSRLNRAPGGVPFPVHAETRAVLERALAIAAASGGALDVTVGPLVRAWGFGAGAADTPPTPAALAALSEQVGWQKLQLGPEGATKAVDALSIDLSAIAKGWAVDEVSRALAALGHRDHMVEVGGEVRAQGTNGSEAPWRIAIEQPDALRRSAHAVVGLADRAMATSGDYRNYREVDGERVSHTIDPRTGRPARHRLASVTVVTDDCVDADGWATALMVLGPDEGHAVATRAGLAAYFLVRTDDGFTGRPTEAFAALSAGPG